MSYTSGEPPNPDSESEPGAQSGVWTTQPRGELGRLFLREHMRPLRHSTARWLFPNAGKAAARGRALEQPEGAAELLRSIADIEQDHAGEATTHDRRSDQGRSAIAPFGTSGAQLSSSAGTPTLSQAETQAMNNRGQGRQ